jgi:hypothetical protein
VKTTANYVLTAAQKKEIKSGLYVSLINPYIFRDSRLAGRCHILAQAKHDKVALVAAVSPVYSQY